jgi:hypothetical protein
VLESFNSARSPPPIIVRSGSKSAATQPSLLHRLLARRCPRNAICVDRSLLRVSVFSASCFKLCENLWRSVFATGRKQPAYLRSSHSESKSTQSQSTEWLPLVLTTFFGDPNWEFAPNSVYGSLRQSPAWLPAPGNCESAEAVETRMEFPPDRFVPLDYTRPAAQKSGCTYYLQRIERQFPRNLRSVNGWLVRASVVSASAVAIPGTSSLQSNCIPSSIEAIVNSSFIRCEHLLN